MKRRLISVIVVCALVFSYAIQTPTPARAATTIKYIWGSLEVSFIPLVNGVYAQSSDSVNVITF